MAASESKLSVEEGVEVAPWVVVMFNAIFFVGCDSHVNANTKRNIMDHFCIDCAKPLCSDCLLHQQHQTHNHVKIRRYIYNDVIKKQDLSKIFDCRGIQTYHTNKAKVIFLKQRRSEQQVQEKEKEKEQEQSCCNRKECCWCIVCDKSLQDNSLYCSIACKVTDIYRSDEKKGDHVNGGVVDHNIHNQKIEDEKRCKKNLMCKKRRGKKSRKGFPLRAPMF